MKDRYVFGFYLLTIVQVYDDEQRDLYNCESLWMTQSQGIELLRIKIPPKLCLHILKIICRALIDNEYVLVERKSSKGAFMSEEIHIGR